jgi:type IV fimbrial biogenesis protein FimT
MHLYSTKLHSMTKTRGFTLVELLVVISIASILAMLAAPSFSRMVTSTSIASDVNTFLADMRFARSEAIKRGALIVMCRSTNPEAANPNCTAGDDWSSGWIIFEDVNDTGTHTASEPLLRQQAALPKSGGVMTGSGTSVTFHFVATGRLRTVGDAERLTFIPNTNSGDNTLRRVVCINVSGRASVVGDGSITSC